MLLVVELSYIAWGAGAAISPDHLLGPGGKAILPAGYEGYAGGSWFALVGASPQVAAYITLLFRMYAIYCVLFGVITSAITITAFRRGERWSWWTLFVGNTIALVSAMAYDKTVNAIGPFELTEYLGLALVLAALAITAPFGARTRSFPATST